MLAEDRGDVDVDFHTDGNHNALAAAAHLDRGPDQAVGVLAAPTRLRGPRPPTPPPAQWRL